MSRPVIVAQGVLVDERPPPMGTKETVQESVLPDEEEYPDFPDPGADPDDDETLRRRHERSE